MIVDVTIDSEVPVVTLAFSRIFRLSLLELLIDEGLRACINRGECAVVCERLHLHCI